MILPTHTMYDAELLHLAERMKIPDFRGVKMRDELPTKPHNRECGILNFNTHDQQGSHWVAWYKSGSDRYYFDSYASLTVVVLATVVTDGGGGGCSASVETATRSPHHWNWSNT